MKYKINKKKFFYFSLMLNAAVLPFAFLMGTFMTDDPSNGKAEFNSMFMTIQGIPLILLAFSFLIIVFSKPDDSGQ
ncbi:hypothetical protein [Gottfriedia acidiceleris]|uniref:hypothetical protein n=1 Tax=Gottfriedia acidiceleris TaxID=371036 RepID=UPI00101DA97D|nr:hypothetical protein [Gottfriedia acidiceleris]